MRRLVLALLATTGCNQIFGLNNTDQLLADATLPDAPYPRMALAYRQIIGTQITTPPIAGATVQVGDYTHDLVDTALDSQGTFALPDPLNTGEYRIVYKLPGDPVAHEVQWSNLVVRDGGTLVVPVFGHVPQPPPPPPGSGYAMTSATYPASWDCQSSATPCMSQPGINMTAYTTGNWASLATSWRRYTHSIGVAAPNMTSMLGTLSAATQEDDDQIIAFSSTTQPDGVVTANAYVVTAVNDLVASAYENLNVTLKTIELGDAATTIFAPGSIHEEARTTLAIGALYNKTPVDTDAIIGGVIPSLVMPSMSLPSYDGSPNSSVLIPLATLAANDLNAVNCTDYFANPFTNHDQNTDAALPSVIMYKQFRTRPAHASGTPLLSSGFQAVSLKLIAPDCNSALGKQPIDVPVGIAGSAMFTKILQYDDTPVTVPQTGFTDLTFSIDKPTTTDDCVVTTYHVTTQLDPIRTILVPVRAQATLAVHVPTADFAAGETYAFGIVCRDNFPGAATGDYTSFTGYPQHESQMFPGTFVVSFQ